MGINQRIAKQKNAKYYTIQIPCGLAKKIDKMIQDSNGDFTSRTDVVKTALRLFYSDTINNQRKPI
jgi:Arc/MetJ-type ribon-helix-helix transcriptional regulator